MLRRHFPLLALLLVAAGLLAACTLSKAPSDAAGKIGGFSEEEALRLGERMYREGLLPSGEPMMAVVQGDIPVDGTMFSCQSCHLRSGLGSAEGTIISLPTNGAKLYKTLHVGAEIDVRPARDKLSKPFQGGDIRPAYSDETLARAIWNGIDPVGRELDRTMPRYLLDEGDMAVLVHYLKNLSSRVSPGVSETTIRFATVVADNVPEDVREAMLKTLEAYVKDHNAQSRHQESRARKGPFWQQDDATAYRRFELAVWELKGSPETWPGQLQAYHRQSPVFALLGGIVEGDWAPVHAFCEEEQIPCIFPATDFPVIAENDWYTVYFSKGPYQEGEAAARYLKGLTDLPDDLPTVQVYRQGPKALMLARGFSETRAKLGAAPPADLVIQEGESLGPDFWKDLASRYSRAVFLLWLGPEDLEEVGPLGAGEGKSPRIFLSSSLLDQNRGSLPEEVRSLALLTYPNRLPADEEKFQKTVRLWLEIRGIPFTNPRIQSNAYFLGWMLTGVMMMMGDDFYQDYFLDILDCMNDQTYAVASYPRLSFGPGQRYAAKGCYLVQLGPGDKPVLQPKTGWVIH